MSSTVKKKGKFPMGFYICSTTFSFERAAYYASKYLIYIFLTTAIVHGGLGIDKGQAAIMQANLVAFTYLAPIIGGYISDRWIGARYTIPIGIVYLAPIHLSDIYPPIIGARYVNATRLACIIAACPLSIPRPPWTIAVVRNIYIKYFEA